MLENGEKRSVESYDLHYNEDEENYLDSIPDDEDDIDDAEEESGDVSSEDEE